MARQYTKVEELSEAVFARKANGETNREIAESYGLELQQIKGLIKRQNKKLRLIAAGYIPRSKGRPRKTEESQQEKLNNELIRLRMQVEVLQNFLSEAGRR
jgi:predicted transcriptional regulator